MAQKKVVHLIDDLDGGDTGGVTTVHFALDGVNYEIDLGPANRQQLADALAPFVAGARTIGQRAGARPAAPTRTSSDEDIADIRNWAREQGHQVKARGRISAEIREAYRAAH